LQTAQSIDISKAPKKSLSNEDKEVIEKLQNIQHLRKEDKTSLLHTIDALISKNTLKSFIKEL